MQASVVLLVGCAGMAGYSQTPLAKKLGIKAGHRVLIVNASKAFSSTLGAVPEGVSLTTRIGKKPYDVAVAFFMAVRDLEGSFATLVEHMLPTGGLWIGWPKKAARIQTDLDEKHVRRVGLASGLVDNKVCAIDETWSGLRFVMRVRDRPAP
jgi:hypothetical protein